MWKADSRSVEAYGEYAVVWWTCGGQAPSTPGPGDGLAGDGTGAVVACRTVVKTMLDTDKGA